MSDHLPNESPDSAPKAQELAEAESAATLTPALRDENRVLTEDDLVRQQLYLQLSRLREQRNRALTEAEAWRQGSLIAVVLMIALALLVFWPF